MVEGGEIDGGGGGCLKELEFVNLFLKNRARRLFSAKKVFIIMVGFLLLVVLYTFHFVQKYTLGWMACCYRFMVSIMEKVEKEIKIKRRKRFLSIETNVPISWLFLDLLFLSFSLCFFGCKSFHF